MFSKLNKQKKMSTEIKENMRTIFHINRYQLITFMKRNQIRILYLERTTEVKISQEGLKNISVQAEKDSKLKVDLLELSSLRNRKKQRMKNSQ